MSIGTGVPSLKPFTDNLVDVGQDLLAFLHLDFKPS